MKSNVIVALLSLGDVDSVLRYFGHSNDPTLRSYLIRKTSEARVPDDIIFHCLQNASLPPETRQALILTLGRYAQKSLHLEKRQEIVKTLLNMFENDRDAGVHSASEWLLRNWNIPIPSLAVEKSDSSPTHRQWFQNSRGQTMVVLDFPDDYQPEAAIKPPPGHRFAIATTETSLRDFVEHKYHDTAVPFNAPPTHPARRMNWFEAAKYCNWLNEQDGIPQSGWCYLPNDDGQYAEGMTVAEDFLSRPGYRLPLAAEWLYAASAGVETPFFFGYDATFLSDYGWTSTNSQGQVHSVGSLQPNVFGLFDVYGNVFEWSHSLEDDVADASHIVGNQNRSILGASYVHFEFHARANYGKHGNPPKHQNTNNGIRVVRTIRPATP
jgi:hypothetical protein